MAEEKVSAAVVQREGLGALIHHAGLANEIGGAAESESESDNRAKGDRAHPGNCTFLRRQSQSFQAVSWIGYYTQNE